MAGRGSGAMVLGLEEKQAERRRALGAMEMRAAYASRACKRSEMRYGGQVFGELRGRRTSRVARRSSTKLLPSVVSACC